MGHRFAVVDKKYLDTFQDTDGVWNLLIAFIRDYCLASDGSECDYFWVSDDESSIEIHRNLTDELINYLENHNVNYKNKLLPILQTALEKTPMNQAVMLEYMY